MSVNFMNLFGVNLCLCCGTA